MQRNWIISFLLVMLWSISFSQDIYTDRAKLMSDANTVNSRFEGRNVKVMSTKHQTFIAKYNPVQLMFTGLMFTYQKVISPQLSATCVYTPSCSSFGKSLIAEYGLIKGLFLTADRLMRCNRAGAMEISPLIVDEQLHLAKDDVKNFKVAHR
jgi:putative membrane protein insertion efficiency factor